MAAAAPFVIMGIGMAASAAATVASSVSSSKTADKNLKFQQEQFEYEKNLQSTIMEREDNAIQRQVADSRAAGVSPLLNMTGSQSAGAAGVAVNAPQRQDTTSTFGSVLQGIGIMSSLVQTFEDFKGAQTDNALKALELQEKTDTSDTRQALLEQSLTTAMNNETRAANAESRAKEMHDIDKDIQDIIRKSAVREYQRKVEANLYDNDTGISRQLKGSFSDFADLLGVGDKEESEKMTKISDVLLDAIYETVQGISTFGLSNIIKLFRTGDNNSSYAPTKRY